MDLNLFLKGTLLGFAIAAPVGPIGILCIRRTLQYGRFSGFFSGLGAAAADTLYGAIAAFGMTYIADFLIRNHFYLHLIGGLFLISLGIKTFFNRPLEKTSTVTHQSLLGDFFSTFFLTLTNPMTILAYVAIFAALGLSKMQMSHTNAVTLVVGVFLGSVLWWLLLSEGITLFRAKVSQNVMLWINRAAGIIIAGFGILTLFTERL